MNVHPFIRKAYYNIQCNDENANGNMTKLATLQATSFLDLSNHMRSYNEVTLPNKTAFYDQIK